MVTFFAKGLVRLGEFVFGNRTHQEVKNRIGYQERRQIEKDLQEMREKVFMQRFL
jgi:hypothetical protein